MHIAICDDNVADRKHLERLLSRESDKRAGTPNILYIESFGKMENVLINPLKYDLFFIDMVSMPNLAHDLVFELKRLGVTAPIVMYSSKVDYTQDTTLPDDIIHKNKPYIPDPLPELLAYGDAHVLGHVSSIEVLVDGITQAVPVNDIYYCLSEGNDTRLYLKDQLTVLVNEPFIDVCHHLEPYDEFYYLNKKTLFNVKFTTLITPFSVIMHDYKTFHYPFWYYNEILNLKDKIERMSQ